MQQINEPGMLVLIDGHGETCLRAEGSCQLSITAGAIGLTNCQECIRAEGNAEVVLSATGDISCAAFGHGIRAEGASAVAVYAGATVPSMVRPETSTLRETPRSWSTARGPPCRVVHRS